MDEMLVSLIQRLGGRELLHLWELFLAGLLGGCIGYERESHGQAAGFRTNILVAFGACLMMQLSLHLETIFPAKDATTIMRLDPGRIASYAIASMGFLGAGAIIKGKSSVRGLTTAASLWLVTGIGLAVGAGFYLPATATTTLSMFVLYFLGKAFGPFLRHELFTVMTVACDSGPGRLRDLQGRLAAFPEVAVLNINVRHDLERQESVFALRLKTPEDIARARIMGAVLAMPGLKRVSWEQGEVP